MKYLYIAIACVAWATPAFVFAQRMDTTAVELSGVEIHATRAHEQHISLLDSLDARRVRTESLGSWLEKRSNLYIMNYGAPGAASTFRFQGLSAAHTSVQWNGVPLGSRSLGLTDLSLVPMSTVQSANFSPNAAQSNDALTTMGGALELSTGMDAHNSVSLSSGYSSMNNLSLDGNVQWNVKQWQQRVQWTRQNNQNRFTYRDDMRFGQPWIEQQHNASLMESVQYITQWPSSKKPRLRAHSALWWTHRRSELPEIMGSYATPLQHQRDSSLRVLAGASYTGKRHAYSLQVAHLRDYQRYTDKARATDVNYSIDSRVNILQWIPQAFWNVRLARQWQAHTGFQMFAVKVSNTNYENGMAKEVYPLATALLKGTFARGGVSANVRYEQRASFATSPAGGLNAWREHTFNFKTLHHLYYALELHRKYRVPDFNERFWVTGVQSALRPEQGWGAQATVRTAWWQKHKLPVTLLIEGFAHRVQGWIQWLPGEGSVWSPVNYKRVDSRGANARLTTHFRRGAHGLAAEAALQYNESIGRNGEDERRFQMPYAPKWMSSMRIDYTVRSFDAGVFARWVDKRFTNDQNSLGTRLPAYTLLSITAGKTWNTRHLNVRVQVNVDNLTNTQYQTVRSYALPGRVYGAAVNIQWKIKTHA